FCTRDWFSRETRFHSAAYMADEIESIVADWGLRAFIMQDDTFTLNKSRIRAFCDAVRQRRLKIDWLATTRVDCVDLDLLRSMRDAGCRVVTFGVESMNPATLKWLKKGFTVERAKTAIGWARQAGLTVRCSYLVGIGDETEEDVRRSLAEARTLPVAKLKANVGLSVYPGTPLYGMAIEAGVLPPDYSYARGWQDEERRYGNGETPRWYTPHVPLERLLELRRETDVNVLFTRPSLALVTHRARKFAGRFRRHPLVSLSHVAQLGAAALSGNRLRLPESPTDH
ncbi:MAG TPA: radical SAM protein, partial [Planctomycetota bacterium]|nr:radical SAM protein [Planctomycetota bacterium]